MSNEALNPAKASFHQAAKALDLIIEVGPEPENIVESGRAIHAWSDLLIYGNRAFTKLEQTSKASAKGRSWFAKVKKARKDHPVLKYMQHARNSDEHAVAQIVHDDGGTFSVDVPSNLIGAGAPIVHLGDDGTIKPAHPAFKLKRTGPPRIILQPVTDRGVVYDVPTDHEGAALSNSDLARFGSIFLSFLETTLSEAEENI
jgi:hypothetical protein